MFKNSAERFEYERLEVTVFSQLRICRPPPSILIQFLWMMCNVLNRMENEIIFYAIFIFRVIVKIHRKLTIFKTKKTKNDHNSKNKNRKNLKFDFSFYSADSDFYFSSYRENSSKIGVMTSQK